MTTARELLQEARRAIDALKRGGAIIGLGELCDSIDAFLAQPEPEPVAWFHDDYGSIELSRIRRVGWKPLYAAQPEPAATVECATCHKTFVNQAFCCERPECPHAANRAAQPEPAVKKKCPEGLLPDGPICPRCGQKRGPSGIDGGTWVHYPQPEPAARPCTCHPDDNPPVPCQQKFALSECRAAAKPEPSAEVLPDCMMPDGADPCRGYRELHYKMLALRAEVERLARSPAEPSADMLDLTPVGPGRTVDDALSELSAEVELVKRLRDWPWGKDAPTIQDAMNEAADAVERLVLERDNLDYKTAYEELEQQFVAMKERAEAAEKLHNELLFLVGQKFPGESRHETAARYIRNAEAGTGSAAIAQEKP